MVTTFGRHIEYERASGGSGAAPTYPGHLYYASGNSVVSLSEMPITYCFDNTPAVLGGRHYEYAILPSIPNVHTAITCCESVGDSINRFGETCWPGGITTPIYGRVFNLANCNTADGIKFPLGFGGLNSSGDPYWTGSFSLRGGDLTVTLTCQTDTEPRTKSWFRLDYTGCASGTQQVDYSCFTPLRIGFANISTDVCCDCFNTVVQSEFDINIEGNCPKTVLGRHIDYTIDGIPIIAADNKCREQPPDIGCITCGLVAEITAITPACLCMEGTYDCPYVSDFWQNTGTGPCAGAGGSFFTLRCVNNGNHTLTFILDISCGADNLGGGEITIDIDPDSPDYSDPDTLDITIPATMSFSSPTCTDSCGWTWDSMAMSWLQDSFCSDPIGCACDTPSTPGSFDGETTTTACTGTVAPPCCEGDILVRFIRL